MINRRALFWEEQGLRKMTKIEWMWEDLKAILSPHLKDGVELERKLAILDFYMRWGIEEFFEYEGILDPRMIVLLRECKRELASLLRGQDGESLYSSNMIYFEHLLALARAVLRRVKVKEAYSMVRRDAEQGMEQFYSPLLDSLSEGEKAVSTEDAALST